MEVDEFVSAVEGSNSVLECVLGGEDIEWVRDGQFPLTSYSGSVVLVHVNHTHQGEYTCSHNGHTHNYYLTVQGEPTSYVAVTTVVT